MRNTDADLSTFKWKAFSFYMPNAIPKLVQLQRMVFDVLNEPLDQVQGTCSHGEFLTETMRANMDQLDAVVFFDLDCIPLKVGVVKKAVRLALKNQMIIGCAQQAECFEQIKVLQRRRSLPFPVRKILGARHRLWQRLGWDPFFFKDPLIYAGPCFLVVPSKIYGRLGRPTLEKTERCDPAGELTIASREQGVEVKCLQPTFCHFPKYKLGNVKRFGLGTVYGRCIFHAFETSYVTNEKSVSLFTTYCEKIIAGEKLQNGHF